MTIKTNKRFSLAEVKIDRKKIEAGLPKKGSCFRIHPDMDRTLEGYVFFTRNGWLLFRAELVEKEGLMGKLQNLYRGKMFQGIDRQGDTFISVVATSGDPIVSADLLEVMEQAKEQWVERKSDVQYGFIPRPDIAHIPKWPNDNFEDVINDAFQGDHFVSSVDHPAIITTMPFKAA